MQMARTRHDICKYSRTKKGDQLHQKDERLTVGVDIGTTRKRINRLEVKLEPELRSQKGLDLPSRHQYLLTCVCVGRGGVGGEGH